MTATTSNQEVLIQTIKEVRELISSCAFTTLEEKLMNASLDITIDIQVLLAMVRAAHTARSHIPNWENIVMICRLNAHKREYDSISLFRGL
jgi:hypothetical protein